VGGYDVPAGTMVLSFLDHILHDPDYWPQPRTFMPERFLDASGKFRVDERFIPFGLGKRQCLGKALANNELILFLGALFQRFSFALPEGKPLPDMEGRVGILRGAPIYNVILTERE
jgi:cytochrome P450